MELILTDSREVQRKLCMPFINLEKAWVDIEGGIYEETITKGVCECD